MLRSGVPEYLPFPFGGVCHSPEPSTDVIRPVQAAFKCGPGIVHVRPAGRECPLPDIGQKCRYDIDLRTGTGMRTVQGEFCKPVEPVRRDFPAVI